MFLLDLFKSIKLLALKLEHQFHLFDKYLRIRFGVYGRLYEFGIFQLQDCDRVHFRNALELFDSRLPMGFAVSNLVVPHIDIIFIACAVDFQCLKESLEVGIIMFVLGTDYLLDVEDSGS